VEVEERIFALSFWTILWRIFKGLTISFLLAFIQRRFNCVCFNSFDLFLTWAFCFRYHQTVNFKLCKRDSNFGKPHARNGSVVFKRAKTSFFCIKSSLEEPFNLPPSSNRFRQSSNHFEFRTRQVRFAYSTSLTCDNLRPIKRLQMQLLQLERRWICIACFKTMGRWEVWCFAFAFLLLSRGEQPYRILCSDGVVSFTLLSFLTTTLSRRMICLLITIKFVPPVCSTFAAHLMEENRNHACTEEEKTLQYLRWGRPSA